MARFRPEPVFDHGDAARDGVLLVNLGTPEAPRAWAVRRYLAEFLRDPRVVEIPRPLWLPVLYGVVLNLRPLQSAKKYAQVWLEEGSPLAVHTRRQAALLRARLASGAGDAAPCVEYAMRYGEPSIAQGMDSLRRAGCDRILVLPLYPQYAASTTASALDALGAWLARARHVPETRVVKHFHDHPAYIEALAAGVRLHWAERGRGPLLVMSFHGLPQYTLERGDPYFCECQKTARLLAEALELRPDQWKLTFQSRFGRTAWLQPYTGPTLVELARAGLQRVDVVCPGFVSDCLETLEELGIAARRAFIAAGGSEFHLLPCLNESSAWIDALATLAREQLWPARRESREDAAARRRRAADLGCTG